MKTIAIEDIEAFFDASEIVARELVRIGVGWDLNEPDFCFCNCCRQHATKVENIKHTDDCAYIIAKQLLS